MRVVVHQVDAHVARPDDAEDRVHVGAVEVEQAAPFVEQLGDRADLRVEQAERIGVGHHEDGRLVVSLALKSSRSTSPLALLLMVTASKPGEMRRGGIRAVGAVGDEDLGPLLAPIAEIGRGDEQGGQLALGAGRRLEAHRVQPRDLGEHLLELEEELEQSLQRPLILIGMLRTEAGQPGQSLVPLRVVLHRARAERVEVRVDRHVERRQVRVVPDDVQLAQLGQGGRRGRSMRLGDHRGERPVRDVRLRQDRRGPPGTAGFEEQRRLIELVHESSRCRFMRRTRTRGNGSRGSRRRRRSPDLLLGDRLGPGSVNDHGSGLGIDIPDEETARGKPQLDLLLDLMIAIVRRAYFDGQVGAEWDILVGFVIRASRAELTKATSAPRTVSGSRSTMKPVSAA